MARKVYDMKCKLWNVMFAEQGGMSNVKRAEEGGYLTGLWVISCKLYRRVAS